MTKVTWSTLIETTNALSMAPHGHDMYLFGSVAQILRESRGSKIGGNDHDLIVTVDEATYLDWNEQVQQRITICDADCTDCAEPDSYLDCLTIRREIGMELLGVETGTPLYYWLLTLN